MKFEKLANLVNKYFTTKKEDILKEIDKAKFDTSLHNLGTLKTDKTLEICIEYNSKEKMDNENLSDYGYCLLLILNDDVILDNIYIKEDLEKFQENLLIKTIEKLVDISK